jgi:hypothetical protein
MMKMYMTKMVKKRFVDDGGCLLFSSSSETLMACSLRHEAGMKPLPICASPGVHFWRNMALEVNKKITIPVPSSDWHD